MKVTDNVKIGCVFAVVLVAAVFMDVTQTGIIKNGTISRDEVGGEEQEIELIVNIEDVLEDYIYEMEIEPANATKEEAEKYFAKAIETIDTDFQEIGDSIPAKETYESGIIEADWMYTPANVVDAEGNIRYEKVSEDGEVVNAEVTLSCGAYEKIYSFAFLVEPKKLTEEEASLEQLALWIEEQMSLEGTSVVELPTKINGKRVLWSEEQDYLTPKILVLEIVSIVLLVIMKKKRQEAEEKKRILQMEKDYPDVVSQLSFLLEAGMTTRQAWNKMASQYMSKKEKGMTEEKPVFEAIVHMNRRCTEGESERAAYQSFSEEINAACYHRLIRIILGNMEKGTAGICARLEEESSQAFEQRILTAKKMGEEASTKMMAPLMIMMILVMGIVMMPAFISFMN